LFCSYAGQSVLVAAADCRELADLVDSLAVAAEELAPITTTAAASTSRTVTTRGREGRGADTGHLADGTTPVKAIPPHLGSGRHPQTEGSGHHASPGSGTEPHTGCPHIHVMHHGAMGLQGWSASGVSSLGGQSEACPLSCPVELL
jgi:hypothetical protein